MNGFLKKANNNKKGFFIAAREEKLFKVDSFTAPKGRNTIYAQNCYSAEDFALAGVVQWNVKELKGVQKQSSWGLRMFLTTYRISSVYLWNDMKEFPLFLPSRPVLCYSTTSQGSYWKTNKVRLWQGRYSSIEKREKNFACNWCNLRDWKQECSLPVFTL